MPIRLGMLGMWHVHADGLVRQLANYPEEFELVAAFDPEPEVIELRRERWRDLCPQLRWHRTPEAVLQEHLDGIVVEGRVHQNLRWARLALEQNYPVLLEKPAGDRFAEFAELIGLARTLGKHVQLIYLFRYMTAVLELIRRVRMGQFGQIYEFRGRLPKDPREYSDYERDLGAYKGGIFFEMAGHLVDLLVTIMGAPANVSSFLAHHAQRTGQFVDNGVAICHMPNGWGILEVPALEVTPGCRRIEVYGSGGAGIIPHLGSGHQGNNQIQRLDLFDAKLQSWQHLELSAATLQISDLREFSAVITGQKQPDYSTEHDLIVHETLLRASGMW